MGKRKQLKRQLKQQQRTIAELERRLEDAAAMTRTTATAIDQMRDDVTR